MTRRGREDHRVYDRPDPLDPGTGALGKLPIREIAERWHEDTAKLHHEYATARDEFRAALLHVIAFHHPGAPTVELDRACSELLGLLG